MAVPADSCDTQLDSQAVREAYFLGRRGDQKTSEFLGAYIKHLAIPEHGPYIADISLYTPYAQVVFNSWRNSVGYSAQQAAEDYRASGDVIPVSVRSLFTPTYLAAENVQPGKDSATQQVYAPRTDGFWRDFQFELYQEKEPSNRAPQRGHLSMTTVGIWAAWSTWSTTRKK